MSSTRRAVNHQSAQARVVGRILLQHPVAHVAKHRLFHDLRSVAALGPLNEILAEAPVAQNHTGFGVATGDKRSEWRQMHGIGGAQPLIMRIGIANELRRQRVEKRLGRRGLNMLVHGRLILRFIRRWISP
jgi:hypothetical protein